MPQCSVCGSNVPDAADTCPDCGTDLKSVQTPAPEPAPSLPGPPPAPEVEAAPLPTPQPSLPPSPAAAARLTLKRSGVLTSEVFSIGDRVVAGRFDAESGPVDVDLGPLPEAAYVSRHHAELWRDTSGQWLIRDLGSLNGTFVRATGQSQFQKATGDQSINDGDEIALGNARFEFRVS